MTSWRRCTGDRSCRAALLVGGQSPRRADCRGLPRPHRRESSGKVQAWAFLDPRARARARPRRCDERRRNGRPLGALHGVPVGIKDIFDTADYPTEYGSALLQGAPADARCSRGRAAACRRRGDPRQDRDAPSSPIYHPGTDAQPARSRTHARRLVVRARRRRSPPAWCRSRSARRPTAR